MLDFPTIQSFLFLTASEEHSSFEMEPSFKDCLTTLVFLMALVEGCALSLSSLSSLYPEFFKGESNWWQDEETDSQRADRIQRSLPVSTFQANDQTEDACCSICLSEFEQNEAVASGSRKCCNNLYHPACLSSWLQVQSTCPCCRQNMLVNASSPIKIPPSATTTSRSQSELYPRRLTGMETSTFIDGVVRQR
jgi:hypothetical protein